MSEPTKEELMALLQTWKFSCEKDCEKECNMEFKEDECKPCFDAIRSLVEAYFEWQEEAALICRKYPGNLLPAATAILLERIRDFGFEVEEKEGNNE